MPPPTLLTRWEHREEPPRRGRLWLIRLLLVLISTAIMLLVLEVGIRLALPYFDPAKQIPFHRNEQGLGLGQPNTEYWVRTPKGDYSVTVRFNRYGLRDPKDLAHSTADDLFAVGDSFTFGWGLPDGQRFSDLLEAKLGRPVYNIAIPGDLLDDALLTHYAEQKGAHPRKLIIGVCMENDLLDYPALRAAKPLPAPLPSRKERTREYLKSHSAIYLALATTLQGNFGSELFEKLGLARNIDELTRRNIYSETVLLASRDALLEVAKGREPLVLLIPSRRLWSGDNTEVESQIHERFAALLREAGLPVVDMRPVFEAAGPPLKYYFQTDPHWNAEGHRLAAEELAKALQSP